MSDLSEVLRVVEEVEIEGTAERVFRALTDPDEIPVWWNDDERYQTITAEIDLRPGGRYRFSGDSARLGTFEVTGTYRIVEPPRRLVYTWSPDWEDGARNSTVEITLAPTQRGTRVRVVHTGFLTPEARDAHAGGWPTVLRHLASHAAV